MGDNVQSYIVVQEDLNYQIANHKAKERQCVLEYRQNEARQEKVKINLGAHKRAVVGYERELVISIAEHGEAPALDIDLPDADDAGDAAA